MATPAAAWMAIKAALRAGESVLHVVGVSAPIAVVFPQSGIVELRVARPLRPLPAQSLPAA